jgi:hypothetical protein
MMTKEQIRRTVEKVSRSGTTPEITARALIQYKATRNQLVTRTLPMEKALASPSEPELGLASTEESLTWWSIRRAVTQEEAEGLFKHIPDTLVPNYWIDMDSCDPEVDCISMIWDCLDNGDDNWSDITDNSELY